MTESENWSKEETVSLLLSSLVHEYPGIIVNPR